MDPRPTEKEGLKPSPEADRYTLLRRVSLDLRGLPPTPEKSSGSFRIRLADAYEKAVDRFLDDPAYGERWARMWLDRPDTPIRPAMAPTRCGPTSGDIAIGSSTPSTATSLTTGSPSSRSPATCSRIRRSKQRIATAFHRNTMTNTEGGTDDEEFRVAAIKDRVDTTMQVWMGLTMGCAKCHSHKFDPITQNEYYSSTPSSTRQPTTISPTRAPVIPAPTAEIPASPQIDAEIAPAQKLWTPTAALAAAGQVGIEPGPTDTAARKVAQGDSGDHRHSADKRTKLRPKRWRGISVRSRRS